MIFEFKRITILLNILCFTITVYAKTITVLDDFESYNNNADVSNAWRTVSETTPYAQRYLETTVVTQGSKSMKVVWTNNGDKSITFYNITNIIPSHNLTRYSTLTFYFKGETGNLGSGQLHAQLRDAAGAAGYGQSDYNYTQLTNGWYKFEYDITKTGSTPYPFWTLNRPLTNIIMFRFRQYAGSAPKGWFTAYYDNIYLTMYDDPINITSFTPTTGTPGTIITVDGSGFGAVQGNGFVQINGINCPVISWTTNQIKFYVPYGATTGVITIQNHATSNGNSANNFTVNTVNPQDMIDGYESYVNNTQLSNAWVPTDGTPLIVITNDSVEGNQSLRWKYNLGASPYYQSITYTLTNSGGADWAKYKKLQLVYKGKSGQSREKCTVQVKDIFGNTIGSYSTPSYITRAVNWTFLDIDLDSFTNGMGLSYVKSIVIFLTPQDYGNGTMQFDAIKLEANDIPQISSISPTSGLPKTILNIDGKNFGVKQGKSTVLINGIPAAEVIYWSSTNIKIKVPLNAESGLVKVRVSDTESTNSDKIFTVLKYPVIESVSTNEIEPGSLLTIKGVNFLDTKGNSVVAFSNNVDNTWIPVAIYNS